MKKLFFISLLIGNSVGLYSQVGKLDSIKVRQRYLLKEYALCECLNYGFRQDSLMKYDFSMSVIFEQLSYRTETYLILDSLIKGFVDSIIPSKYADTKGKRGIMNNCIDYYNSKKFNLFIKKFDGKLILDDIQK
jgi:hypothetical protein